MNALVTLQIMISVETLRALVTLEWTIVLRLRLGRRASVHLQGCSMAAVETMYESMGHGAYQHGLTVGIVDVGHDGPVSMPCKLALHGVWRLDGRGR